MPRFRLPLPIPRSQRGRRRIGRKAGWSGMGIVVMLALVLLDRVGVFGRAHQADWGAYNGQAATVVHVVDGDTLDVNIRDGGRDNTRIRLLGVDTPETVAPDKPVQFYGPQASQYTKDKALGRRVTIQLDSARTRDKYGRLLAYVILEDGSDLSEQLIATGHGYADPRYKHPRKKEFERVQEQAQRDRRGLWQNVTDKDLPYYYQGKLSLP